MDNYVAGISRHLMLCHLTQETRVENAKDDVQVKALADPTAAAAPAPESSSDSVSARGFDTGVANPCANHHALLSASSCVSSSPSARISNSTPVQLSLSTLQQWFQGGGGQVERRKRNSGVFRALPNMCLPKRSFASVARLGPNLSMRLVKRVHLDPESNIILLPRRKSAINYAITSRNKERMA